MSATAFASTRSRPAYNRGDKDPAGSAWRNEAFRWMDQQDKTQHGRYFEGGRDGKPVPERQRTGGSSCHRWAVPVRVPTR